MPLCFFRSERKETEIRPAPKQLTQDQDQKVTPKKVADNAENTVHTVKRRFTFDASDGLPTAMKSPQKLASGKKTLEGESEDSIRQRHNSAPSQLFGIDLSDPLPLNSFYDGGL